MKSRKSAPKWKPKPYPNSSAESSKRSSGSIESKAPSSTNSRKPTTMTEKKLVESMVGDAKSTSTSGPGLGPGLVETTYSSFVSGISDCSSCDRQQQMKATNLKSVEQDCENVLQQVTNTFAQIAQAPRKPNDARQIGVQCLEYVNVILFNIEWLEREQSQAADQRVELDKNLLHMQQRNIQLKDEIYSMQHINSALKHENREILADLYHKQDNLKIAQEENNSLRSAVENEERIVKGELEKLADSSARVETAIKEKDVRWDNLNYYLQKRVAQLQSDHQQLKVNYDLMCNALRVGNGGDVHNELVDVGALEAGHEAEMVMMKYAHESFISELNKLNCKLWNEKFYKRSRLEEEMKKNDLYQNWLVALKQDNAKYRGEITSLNKQIEDLLDVICSKLQNKCRDAAADADGVNDKYICFECDISST